MGQVGAHSCGSHLRLCIICGRIVCGSPARCGSYTYCAVLCHSVVLIVRPRGHYASQCAMCFSFRLRHWSQQWLTDAAAAFEARNGCTFFIDFPFHRVSAEAVRIRATFRPSAELTLCCPKPSAIGRFGGAIANNSCKAPTSNSGTTPYRCGRATTGSGGAPALDRPSRTGGARR